MKITRFLAAILCGSLLILSTHATAPGMPPGFKTRKIATPAGAEKLADRVAASVREVCAVKESRLLKAAAAADACRDEMLASAVAQLDSLMRAGRGAGRHGGAAHRAVFEHDIDLDRRIAAGIEDLAADDVDDRGHVRLRS